MQQSKLTNHLKKGAKSRAVRMAALKSIEIKQLRRSGINFVLEDITSFAKKLQPLRFGNYNGMFRQLILQISGSRVRFQFGEYVPDSGQEHTANSDNSLL